MESNCAKFWCGIGEVDFGGRRHPKPAQCLGFRGRNNRDRYIVSTATSSGIATLNHEVTRQAAMIAYNDDFGLMLFVILAPLPLLLLVRAPRRHLLPAAADD